MAVGWFLKESIRTKGVVCDVSASFCISASGRSIGRGGRLRLYDGAMDLEMTRGRQFIHLVKPLK